MEIIFKIFYKQVQSYNIGDYFMYRYNNSPVIVNSINPITGSLNNGYQLTNCSKLPFTFSTNTMLTDDIITIIKDQYEKSSEDLKKTFKNEFEFIVNSKYINNNMYKFYNKIKNIEFIPKTPIHIKTLYNAINF